MDHVITVRDLVLMGVAGLVVCGIVAGGLWFLAQLNSDL